MRDVDDHIAAALSVVERRLGQIGIEEAADHAVRTPHNSSLRPEHSDFPANVVDTTISVSPPSRVRESRSQPPSSRTENEQWRHEARPDIWEGSNRKSGRPHAWGENNEISEDVRFLVDAHLTELRQEYTDLEMGVEGQGLSERDRDLCLRCLLADIQGLEKNSRR